MHTVKEVLRVKYLGNLSKRNIETLAIASKSAVFQFHIRFQEERPRDPSGLGYGRRAVACLFVSQYEVISLPNELS
jgi:hypothetical protein